MIYEIEITTRTDYWSVYAPKEEYEKFKDKLLKGDKYIEINGIWGESVCVKADEIIGVNASKQEEVMKRTIERIEGPLFNNVVDLLTVVLFALKVLGKINIGWLAVFTPVIIDVVVKVIVFIIALNIKE